VAGEANDGAAVRVPPPLVFVAGVLAGAALGLVAPLRLPLSVGARIGATALIGALGLCFGGPAFALMRRSGQNPAPWTSTPELLGGGVYRVSRNPMYVGMALLQTAIGVGAANGWILLLVPVALAAVYATAVRHEEAYLERKFGEPYLAYKRRVRRWI
jgi:protein-S-isoprenylcysteine O-methyltransferase Ste14